MKALLSMKVFFVATMVAAMTCSASTRAVSLAATNRDADNNIVSFDLTISEGSVDETNTLYIAYGVSDGGDTTNGWDVVEKACRVLGGETSKTVAAPEGIGPTYRYVKFFLSSGFEPDYDRLVSHVRANGSYLNTEYVPNQDTRVLGEFYVTGTSEYWFGCWGSYVNSAAYAIRGTGEGKYYHGYDGQGSDVAMQANFILNTHQLIDFNKNVASVTVLDGASAGAVQYEKTYTYKAFSAIQKLYVFAFNQAGSRYGGGNIQCHWLKIYDNGTMVRDYLPAVRGDVIGLYDALNDCFYPTVGGTVTAGDTQADLFRTAGEIVASSATLSYRQCTVTAAVVPAKAGTITMGASQTVDAGGIPGVMKVMRSHKDANLIGWRAAGTTEILATGYEFQPPTATDDVIYEAVFTAPDYDWTYAARYDSAACVEGVCDGLSWATAFTNLAEAIGFAAIFEGEVWVKAGTHTMPTDGVSLKSHVRIMGGFEGVDGKTPAEELAARDIDSHESILTGSYVVKQYGTADETAIIDGITFADCKNYAIYTSKEANIQAPVFNASNTRPVFTNCTFRGNAPVWMTAPGNRAKFYGCKFTAMSGGQYGRLFFECENGGTVEFHDCLLANTKQNGWPFVNFSSGNGGLFEDCLFTNNTVSSYGDGNYTAAAIAGRVCAPTFRRCKILWNTSENGGSITRYGQLVDCLVASNTVRHTTSTAASYLLVACQGSKIHRSSIVDNVFVREHPDTTGVSVSSAIFNVGGHQVAGGSSTIANNRFIATLGEGMTASFVTIGWSGVYYGGFVNCTFWNNDVTTEITEGCSDRRDANVTLINNVFWNDRADYRALKSTVESTTYGFAAYNNVIKGYDPEDASVHFKADTDNTAEDPGVMRRLQVGPNGERYQPVAKHGGATLPTLEVEVGANGAMRIPSQNNYRKCFNDTDLTAPITKMPDVLGNPWPTEGSFRGSAYVLHPTGLSVLVR